MIPLVTICNYLFLLRKRSKKLYFLEGRDILVDQTLPYSESSSLSRAGKAVKGKWGTLLRRFPPLRSGALTQRSRQAVIFLASALSLCSVSVLGALYGPSCQVSVDGVKLGAVNSRQDIEKAILQVEKRASNILGHDYTLHQSVSYRFCVSLKEARMTSSQVETYLFDQIGEVMKTSVLRVNGQIVGAVDDGASLDAMLESIQASYMTENTVSVQFVDSLAITREYTATSAIRDVADMEKLLTSNTTERVDYTVRAGDTFSGIAARLDMPMKDLQALNPGIDINKLMIGQVLVTRQAVPFLSVRTVDSVTYDGSIPYTVETVNDNTIYEGSSKVLTRGVDGWATYTADVTYVNGVEQERVILDTQVHTEPVTQVVAIGVKPRPRTMATGRFIWPLRGRIASGYGSRYIFGSYSFHSGIDITGAYGAAIAAADGGKVVFSGTGRGSYWSYGNYVEIDHENGLHTIYAHCSSLNVRTGDRVYQGQTIARVGATGRATGNHLHFQVKRSGETVNPYHYLP